MTLSITINQKPVKKSHLLGKYFHTVTENVLVKLKNNE